MQDPNQEAPCSMTCTLPSVYPIQILVPKAHKHWIATDECMNSWIRLPWQSHYTSNPFAYPVQIIWLLDAAKAFVLFISSSIWDHLVACLTASAASKIAFFERWKMLKAPSVFSFRETLATFILISSSRINETQECGIFVEATHYGKRKYSCNMVQHSHVNISNTSMIDSCSSSPIEA